MAFGKASGFLDEKGNRPHSQQFIPARCIAGIVDLSCCLDLSGQSSCGDGVVMLASCAHSSSFRESSSCGALVGRSVPTLQFKIVLSWFMKAEAVRVQTLNRTSCSFFQSLHVILIVDLQQTVHLVCDISFLCL